MNPTPTPSPIEVVLHAAPAADWQILAAFAPLIAALIAAGIAVATLRQRSNADRKAEWWRRAQWALDTSYSDDPERSQLGLDVIADLAQSAPGADEARIIQIASNEPLLAAEEDLEAAKRRPFEIARDMASAVAGATLGIQLPRRAVDDKPADGDNGSTTAERKE